MSDRHRTGAMELGHENDNPPIGKRVESFVAGILSTLGIRGGGALARPPTDDHLQRLSGAPPAPI